MNAEQQRLQNPSWKKWGPYLSERQWGTVREDYSEYGNAWDFFPHDHARSRVYRWGEDGIAGISDDMQRVCFAVSLWNGRDPILKERLFGLTGNEGNHGEDVKELYYYLDNTPSHAYMKHLYKYPQAEYPYADIVHTNRNRSKFEREYEFWIREYLMRADILMYLQNMRRRTPKIFVFAFLSTIVALKLHTLPYCQHYGYVIYGLLV